MRGISTLDEAALLPPDGVEPADEAGLGRVEVARGEEVDLLAVVEERLHLRREPSWPK